MRLIFQRPVGHATLWLTGVPLVLAVPEGAWLAVHLPVAAPSSTLVLTTRAGHARLPAPGAGWAILPGTAVTLHAEGPPLRLSGGDAPACRVWSAGGLIPEAHWRAARILGDGAVLALAGGPARPFVRLRAGGMARITLPDCALPGPIAPVIGTLRGQPPLAELSGLALTLRAGADCEVVWEDVQPRPNSRANSAGPSRR